MYLLTPCPGRSGTDLAELPHLEPSRWTSGQRWKPRHTSRCAEGQPPARPPELSTAPSQPSHRASCRPSSQPLGSTPQRSLPSRSVPSRPASPASRPAAAPASPRPRLQHPPPGRPTVVLTRLVPPSLCCWWGLFCCGSLLEFALVCEVVSFLKKFTFSLSLCSGRAGKRRRLLESAARGPAEGGADPCLPRPPPSFSPSVSTSPPPPRRNLAFLGVP